METIPLIGIAAASLIGIVLGLIGGGGSILTVPVLVYILYLNPVTATAYSLFIVGTSALAGSFRNVKKGLVDFRTALVFSIPALIAVYSTRKFIVPALPQKLLVLGNITVTRDIGIMVFFGLIMLVAAISMIRNGNKETHVAGKVTYNYPLILIEGLVVGVLTGIVGAGGGFLIIPALVLFAKLQMKKAVATSLVIIAIKSLIGFIGDVENLQIDWVFLLTFSAISILGIYIGIWLNRFIDGKKLKKGFGWFIVLMSLVIIGKELMG